MTTPDPTYETERAAVRVDSDDYRHTFYGILNADGQFWTPIPFGNESDARQYLEKYAIGDNCRMLRTHKIVPVRIQLTALHHERTGK